MTIAAETDHANQRASFVPKPRKSKAIVAGTRAVQRDVASGGYDDCVRCGLQIKFAAKDHKREIICNIYEIDPHTNKPRWFKLDKFHPDCYEAAGNPHGAVLVQESSRDTGKRQAKAEASRRAQKPR